MTESVNLRVREACIWILASSCLNWKNLGKLNNILIFYLPPIKKQCQVTTLPLTTSVITDLVRPQFFIFKIMDLDSVRSDIQIMPNIL